MAKKAVTKKATTEKATKTTKKKEKKINAHNKEYLIFENQELKITQIERWKHLDSFGKPTTSNTFFINEKNGACFKVFVNTMFQNKKGTGGNNAIPAKFIRHKFYLDDKICDGAIMIGGGELFDFALFNRINKDIKVTRYMKAKTYDTREAFDEVASEVLLDMVIKIYKEIKINQD